MKLSTLYAKTKRAVMEYGMIQPGDRIAVGLSGGKDSLALLFALSGLAKQPDMNFELNAVLVDMGFEGFDSTPLANFCDSIGVPFTCVKTELGKVIFEERKEQSPCSMCAKMRRGILNRTLKELNCGKLALGHHRDDFINTWLLSLLREGRFHTMQPVSYMSDAGITLVRPLLYVTEDEIKQLTAEKNLPVVKQPCPVDGVTDRAKTAKLICEIKKSFPDCEERFFSALKGADFFSK